MNNKYCSFPANNLFHFDYIYSSETGRNKTAVDHNAIRPLLRNTYDKTWSENIFKQPEIYV